MKRYHPLFLFLLLTSVASADGLAPFTTDGCSLFPDGTLEHQSLWVHCCIRHDLAYWKGGTEQQRLEADQALQQCVAQTGEPKIAQLMLAGVRVGGSPVSVMNYRWGYGWPLLRGYKELTTEETKEVQQQLARFEVMVRGLYRELGLGATN